MSLTKNQVFNLIPSAMVTMVIAFWGFAPKAVTDNARTLTVVMALTLFTVLLLERVHERHAGWRMDRQEFFTDLFYVVLSATAITWATAALAESPLKVAKASFGITTQWALHMPWLLQVALVVFLIEFGQYWMHRLMHHARPFWLTHAVHHHITQLNAAKGAVGNPIELFLITLSVVALFDLEKTAIFAAFGTTGVISTFAHANVRSNPPRWYSYVFTSIQHHSLHHSPDYESTRCNYGNSLILLDRIFGTFREGESAIVGQDDRRRLSIREQTLFPFRGLIDDAKARRAKTKSGAGPAAPEDDLAGATAAA